MDLWRWAPVPSDLPISSGFSISVTALSNRRQLAVTQVTSTQMNHVEIDEFTVCLKKKNIGTTACRAWARAETFNGLQKVLEKVYIPDSKT